MIEQWYFTIFQPFGKKNLLEVNMANVSELCKKYETREQCCEFLEHLRWPQGVKCPHCESDKVYRVKSRFKYECSACRYQFSVTSGTIFHRSHLPLQKWIIASLLIANAKKGISAMQLMRDLNVTYKTAWYLGHRLRRAMKEDTIIRKMRGVIEVDETYVGGRSHKITGRGALNKTVVGGALERGGWVTARVLENASAKEVCKPIYECADIKNVSMVCSDEWRGYNQLRREFNLQRVFHCYGEYARRGYIHTNGIENFWGILKRGIIGSFHKISRKYMQFYLDEFSFRYSWTAKGRPLYGKKSNGAFMEKILSNALIKDPALKG
jgi:transposase-like protein